MTLVTPSRRETRSCHAAPLPSTTQAAGATKIFLRVALEHRRQVEGLASDCGTPLRLPVPAWPLARNAAGKVEADLDKFLEEWLGGESSVSILDLSGVPSEVLARSGGFSYASHLRVPSSGPDAYPRADAERPLLFVFAEATPTLQ